MANEKIFLAIAAGYGAALWCGTSALRKSWLLARARRWPSTRGKILEAVFYEEQDPDRTHSALRYEFTVGERIEGCTGRLSGGLFWSKDEEADFIYQFVMGDEVEVFYDPADPRRNCLDRDDPGGIFMLWFTAAAGAIIASACAWWFFH